jgi:histidinol-phosphate aminotransferase
MHAYAIQPSAGLIKLDAMENPFRLPPALQRELGERLGRVAINRYPVQSTADVVAALSRLRRPARGLQADPGQRLRRADRHPARWPATCPAPPAGAAAGLRDVRDVGAAARAEVRGRAADAGLRAGRSRHAGRHRTAPPALTYIAYPNNPTANLWDDAVIDRIVAAVGAPARPGGVRRGLPALLRRSWMQRLAQHPHVLVMRTLSKFGLAGVRLGYLWGHAALIDEVDKVRPPYNISVLNAEAALFALEHADEYAAPGRAACAASASAPAGARWPPARRAALPQRGQHGAGARARRQAPPSPA